jgi:hypothetical protein
MSDVLEFDEGSSKGNDSVFGAPSDWVRSKNGIGLKATYNRGRPKKETADCFFSVVWKIRVERGKKPEWDRAVRLEVESPRHDRDPRNPALNDLKRRVIKALLSSNLGAVERASVSEDKIKDCITITPFKVPLGGSQIKTSHKETIKAVHKDIGRKVDAVLQQFAREMETHFGPIRSQ